MKKLILSVVYFLVFGAQLAIANNSGNPNSTNTMIPLPLRINFNGMLMWGYNLNFGGGMGHSDSMASGNGMQGNGAMNGGSGMQMEQGWMYATMPMIALGGDTFTNIVNLDKSDSGELVWDKNSSNLVIAQNKTITVAAGIGVMAMPPASTIFALKVNLMPYKGGHVYRMKHLSSKKEAKSIDQMKVPMSLEDLDRWKINDQISYSSKGGVMFGAGAGMSILVSVMKTHMAEGGWHTTVKKVDDTFALATLRKNKLKMLSVNISNMLVQLSVGKMKNTDKGFNFIYDLSDAVALDAYKRFLNGDILHTQRLLLEGVNTIEMLKTYTSKATGSSRKFTAGLPFLFNTQSTKGEMINTSFVHNGFTDRKVKLYMGMYKKTHTTDGTLSNHKNGGIVFMTMASKKQKMTSFKPRYAGTFKWYYSKQDVSKKVLIRKIKKAVKKLGVDSLKKVSLPVNDKIGYIKLEVDISLNFDETNKLMNSDNRLMASDSIVRVENFFKSKKNLKDYCSIDIFLNICKKRVIKETKRAMRKMPSLLANMRESLLNKDLNGFTKKYAQLGKLAFTNRFVLAQILKMAGKKSLNAIVNIEGSNIQRYRAVLEGEL